MGLKVELERLEVGERALGRHEAHLHQPARRIVDEHQQRAAGVRHFTSYFIVVGVGR